MEVILGIAGMIAFAGLRPSVLIATAATAIACGDRVGAREPISSRDCG